MKFSYFNLLSANSLWQDVALSDKKRIRLDPTLVRQCCITGSIQPLGSSNISINSPASLMPTHQYIHFQNVLTFICSYLHIPVHTGTCTYSHMYCKRICIWHD